MVRTRLSQRFYLLLGLGLCLASPTFGQHSASSSRFEIQSLQFTGNDALNSGELHTILLTRQTPGFLSKFLHNTISEALGRANEFFDPVVFAEDMRRLRQYYEDHGFFEARIDSSLTFSEEENSVEILISFEEGYRSIIDSIEYRGIVHVPDFVFEDMENGRGIGQGDFYDQALLKKEIDHILTVLKNAGYPNVRYLPDSSWALRPVSKRNFLVVLTFDIGKRYLFGPISITREDSAGRQDIADEVVFDQLDYREGGFYSQQSVIESERNLNRIGLFDLARIRVNPPANEDPSIHVPSTITIRPTDKHELAPELVLSDENSNFNIGTGLGYKNRNFFGGGRTFSTRLRFRTQTIAAFPDYFNLNNDAVSNVDLTFEMLQPYVFSNKIKGSWSFSLILDKERPYRQFIVRNKFGFTARFAEYTNGFLDWSLERVQLKQSPTFNGTPEEIADLQRQARQVQFNSILSFTIQRNKANDLFSPSSGFVHSATIEESGLLPLLLKRVQSDLPFTQFYRFLLSGRWYYDGSGSRYSILGLKLKGGFEEKYGESRSDPERVIPQTHRLYAGGGGSVRGWESRKLTATGDPRAEAGGNLLLEGSLEWRLNILQASKDGFLDKFWTVMFLDAGNIWDEATDFQFQDVAIATGMGIRYDTFFGPFRIDYGIRVFDPRPEYGKKWIFQRKFVSEVLGEGVLHFGIGHAF